MMYKRVPPVFSWVYFRVFLNAIDKEGYNRQAIRKAIFDERVKFEREKFKATGRGYRLKTVKSERLVRNCYSLSRQIGLLQRTDNHVLLSEESKQFLSNDFTHPKAKSLLLGKLLKTYIPFNEVLFCIRNQAKGEFLLPLGKETSPFKSLAEGYRLKVDKIQFQVVRDLLTQLGVLNWREKKDGARMQKVYLIVVLLKLSEVMDLDSQASKLIDIENLQIDQFVREVTEEGRFSLEKMPSIDILKKAEKKGYIVIKLHENADYLFIKDVDVSTVDFEEVLWKEYLKMSDYKSSYPVYYSELRDNVCERLRTSDKAFDSFVKRMINKPHEFTVKLHPGGGPMPPRRGLSSMLKALPPKTGSDEYITFLKATK